MKKAKIILTAIAVMAIVGGALAFKAKRGQFLAYTPAGSTITSFVLHGLTYRTIVAVCNWSGKFIDPNGVFVTITLSDLFKIVTAYSTLNGVPVSATSLEFVCTPTITATTDDF